MQNFGYDVAISFAGDQRPEAEGIAKLLREAGVKVFYDEYEKVALWGKDFTSTWPMFTSTKRATA